jgi:hypothetical protein
MRNSLRVVGLVTPPRLARELATEREFPTIFDSQPEVQLHVQVSVPDEELLPVGHYAPRDGRGITVKGIVESKPISAGPGSKPPGSFQVTQHDFAKPLGGIVDHGGLAVHGYSPFPASCRRVGAVPVSP